MKYVFLSHNANSKLKSFLTSLGKIIIEIKCAGKIYVEISDHPDIYVCAVADNIIIAKEQLENVLSQINHLPDKAKIIPGINPIGREYPLSCIFNGVQLGNFFIHNIKYTDLSILEAVKESNLKFIDVMQGYTNCNVVVVDENSMITSDPGIYKKISLLFPEIDILKINSGNVVLNGFEYGFLGGTSGKIDDYLIFNGNLEDHPDFTIIKNFIESKNIKLKYFKEYPLTDIGSIIGF